MDRVQYSMTHQFSSTAHEPKVSTPAATSFLNAESLGIKLRTNAENGEAKFDLDDLFAKHTIAEVKAIQRQLRADADAKQEELRLMVGERYRDLLQASSSIISIARSSKRVVELLQETKAAILAEEDSPYTQTLSSGGDDSHLHTLRLLSAHIKLLLDAPEHLWRLIETKKFLSAAWLFLLARLIHRALTSDDEADSNAWRSYGIVVLEQFPLVQRQWDSISHFRSQIVHKATLSLRECASTPEDVCAVLLTLHLLDSQPLTETLSELLSQRSKTVHAILSRSSNRQTNGYPPEIDPKTNAAFHRTTVRNVRRMCLTALESICSTVSTCRNIFELPTPTKRSLIARILGRMQSDDVPGVGSAPASELEMTTQSLLASLPSSNHYFILPPDLRNYKPYVELDSPSSFMPCDILSQKLGDWFNKSTNSLQNAVERWIADLQSVKEVWDARSSVRNRVHAATGLTDAEKGRIKCVFEDACTERILGVWKQSLSSAEKDFKERLQSATHQELTTIIGASAPEFLFNPPPLPSLSSISSLPLPTTNTSLQDYRSTLQKQLNGRTHSLDEVLMPLEVCARNLNEDVCHVLPGQGDDTRTLIATLIEAYQTDADSLCTNVLGAVAAASRACPKSSCPRRFLFMWRVASMLNSSSFSSHIHCSDEVANEFRSQTKALEEQIIGEWRGHIVVHLVSRYYEELPILPSFSVFPPASAPSLALMKTLLSLSGAIQEFGVFSDPSQRTQVTSPLLQEFMSSLLKKIESVAYQSIAKQLLWDLYTLDAIAKLWEGDGWENCSTLLSGKISQLKIILQEPIDINLETCSDYLFRSQILMEALLPSSVHGSLAHQSDEKLSSLLHHGSSSANLLSVLDITKPAPRFALLLVNTEVQ